MPRGGRPILVEPGAGVRASSPHQPSLSSSRSSFESVPGSVPLDRAGTPNATLNFGNVSAFEPLNPGVNRTVGASSYTISTSFGVRVTHLVSSEPELHAAGASAERASAHVAGRRRDDVHGSATISTSQPYGPAVPHTLCVRGAVQPRRRRRSRQCWRSPPLRTETSKDAARVPVASASGAAADERQRRRTAGRSSGPRGGISLSPSVVMLSGQPGQAHRQTLRLTNHTSRELAFRLEAQDVVADEGRRAFIAAGERSGSIAATAVFSPKEIVIAPGAVGIADVTLTLPPGSADPRRRGHLPRTDHRRQPARRGDDRVARVADHVHGSPTNVRIEARPRKCRSKRTRATWR